MPSDNNVSRPTSPASPASAAADGHANTPELAPESTDKLSVALYDELRAIAHNIRRGDREQHTLDTTAIVHEAFLRLASYNAADWPNRAYFLGAAARTMRRVLVDYARERGTVKRDGGTRTTLSTTVFPAASGEDSEPLDVLVIDDLLDRLARLDERQARVVELRVFGGFGQNEIAEILGVSPKTVYRDWRFAKAWLACRLGETE